MIAGGPSTVTRSIRLLLMLVGVLLFVVGLLVGQEAHRSKFEKYLRPINVTQMQFALLEANIGVIRRYLSGSETGTPIIEYDPSCMCFWSTTLVSTELMKKPLEEVRLKLSLGAMLTRQTLKQQVPELSDAGTDFKMRFQGFNGTSWVTVAEYADGKIVFK